MQNSFAEVAELADAHGSGPCGGNTMRVQVPSSARKRWSCDCLFFCFCFLEYDMVEYNPV